MLYPFWGLWGREIALHYCRNATNEQRFLRSDGKEHPTADNPWVFFSERSFFRRDGLQRVGWGRCGPTLTRVDALLAAAETNMFAGGGPLC